MTRWITIPRTCQICGAKFDARGGRQFKCTDCQASVVAARNSDPLVKLKRNARERVAAAIRKGLLTRAPCEGCGTAAVQAHHVDYARPLDVRWLCVSCHSRTHERLRWAS